MHPNGSILTLLVLTFVLAAPAVPAHAQERGSERFAERASPVSRGISEAPLSGDGRSTLDLVGAGTLGVLAGAVGGGLVGYGIETAGACEAYFCGLTGAIYGGLLGETIATPLAVHLANGRKGSYGYGLLASVGVVAGSVALATSIGPDGNERAAAGILLAIPIAQIAASVAVERLTSRAAGR